MGSVDAFWNTYNNLWQMNMNTRKQNADEDYQNKYFDEREKQRQAEIDRLMKNEAFEREMKKSAHDNRMSEILENDRLSRKRMEDAARIEEDMKIQQFNREWGPGGPKARGLPENQPAPTAAEVMAAENKKMEMEQKNRELKAGEKAFAEEGAWGDGSTVEDVAQDLLGINGGVPGVMNGEGLADKRAKIADGDGRYGLFNRKGRKNEVAEMSDQALAVLERLEKIDPQYITPEIQKEMSRAVVQLDGDDLRELFRSRGIASDDQMGAAVVEAMKRGDYTPDEAREMLMKLGIKG